MSIVAQKRISEELLYYVWGLKRFDLRNLTTVDGTSIEILKFGYRNEHSGPDFHHAKLKLGDKIWVGHIEMHVKSSDWYKHKHDRDQAFQNVILHVVFDHDREIYLPNGEPLPCLELQARIDDGVIENYDQLLESNSWIPCAHNQKNLPEIKWHSWYERLLVERLSEKTNFIEKQLIDTEHDWEEVFYRSLARNFGFKVNADAFESLAQRLPLKIIRRHKDKLREIEALLFGQSGLISEHDRDEYAQSLYNNYTFFAKKYKLVSLEAHHWKFMRMRPANFPTIRIAQFAVLLFKSNHLFSKALAANGLGEIRNLFSCEVSAYWKKHYSFGKSSTMKSKKMGFDSIVLVVINTVVPFLFVYGQKNNDEKYAAKAFKLLEELKAEKNKITRGFLQLDFPCRNAFDSQALIQLKNNYCDQRKCLSCAVGIQILKPSTES